MKRLILLVVMVSMLLCGLAYGRFFLCRNYMLLHELDIYYRETVFKHDDAQSKCVYDLDVIYYKDKLLTKNGY